MKNKNSKKIGLLLEKTKIAQLNNLHLIRGGNFGTNNGDDNIDDDDEGGDDDWTWPNSNNGIQ